MKELLIIIAGILIAVTGAWLWGRSVARSKCAVEIAKWEQRLIDLDTELNRIQAEASALVETYQDSVSTTLEQIEDLKKRNVNLNYRYNEVKRKYENIGTADTTVSGFVESWSELIEQHPIPNN